MARHLTINPTPFKPSNLAIPPSPFSPQSPITPPASPSPKRLISTDRDTRSAHIELQLASPPAVPLRWLWQCHICNRVYQLGVTRRCLDDGHSFCAGTTIVRKNNRTNKNVIRHKACASEFDYQSWKDWGNWRRSVIARIEAATAIPDNGEVTLHVPTAPREPQWMSGNWAKKSPHSRDTKQYWLKDCWNTCDYPSECRWGKQYGVNAATNGPAKAAIPSTLPTTPPPPSRSRDKKPSTTFDGILLDVTSAIAEMESGEYVEPVTQQTTQSPSYEPTKKPSVDELLKSAKRRKRKSAGVLPSPLGSNPPCSTKAELLSTVEALPEESSSASYLQRAFGDFELDVRKSLERAGDVVSGWAKSVRATAAVEEDEG